MKVVAKELPVGVARRDARTALTVELGPGYAAASELMVWRPREVGFDVSTVPEVAWTTATALDAPEAAAWLVVQPPRVSTLLDLVPAGTRAGCARGHRHRALLTGAAGWTPVPHDGRFADAPALSWASAGLTTRGEVVVALARAAECRIRLD